MSDERIKELRRKAHRFGGYAELKQPLYEALDLAEQLQDVLKHVREEHADAECGDCGQADCVWKEPFHYHHDGCPAEWATEQENKKLQERVQELEQQVRNCHTEIAQVVEPSEASCDCDFCEEGR